MWVGGGCGAARTGILIIWVVNQSISQSVKQEGGAASDQIKFRGTRADAHRPLCPPVAAGFQG